MSDNDEGFTLIELLLAVTMSGIIGGALFAVLLVTFKTTTGLAANAPAFGKQNSGAVGSQVSVNNEIQVLTKTFSSDAANVTSGSAVAVPGSLTCARPAADPALGTDQPVVRFDYLDNTGLLHKVNYRFSTDSLRHQGELTRYDCTTGPAVTTVLTAGLDSSGPPTVTSLCPSGGVVAVGSCASPVSYRLSVTTLTGRQYALDGSPRASSGTLAAVGALTPNDADPLPDGVSMVDSNRDGFIDSVLVKYPNDPSSLCLPASAWQSTHPPSGSSLGTPNKPGGNTIALPYVAPTGPVDTAASSFTVTFTPPNGCSLNPFTSLAPIDKASPLLVALQPGAGVTPDGKPDPGDSFSLTFSEPLDPASVPSQVRLVEQNASNRDRLFLTAVGGGADLTQVQGVDLGADGVYLPKNSSASYLANVTVDNPTAPTVITVTIPATATCDTGDCTSFKSNAGSAFTFIPGTGLHDGTTQQNAATTLGTLPVPTGTFRMY